jgi:hypothetical protein
VGEFLWPKGSTQGGKIPPLPSDISTLAGHTYSNPLNMFRIRHYLKYVFDHQWELSDFQNPLIVKEIIESGGLCHPYVTRRKYSAEEIRNTAHIERIASNEKTVLQRWNDGAKQAYLKLANTMYEYRHRAMGYLEKRIIGEPR